PAVPSRGGLAPRLRRVGPPSLGLPPPLRPRHTFEIRQDEPVHARLAPVLTSFALFTVRSALCASLRRLPTIRMGWPANCQNGVQLLDRSGHEEGAWDR